MDSHVLGRARASFVLSASSQSRLRALLAGEIAATPLIAKAHRHPGEARGVSVAVRLRRHGSELRDRRHRGSASAHRDAAGARQSLLTRVPWKCQRRYKQDRIVRRRGAREVRRDRPARSRRRPTDVTQRRLHLRSAFDPDTKGMQMLERLLEGRRASSLTPSVRRERRRLRMPMASLSAAESMGGGRLAPVPDEARTRLEQRLTASCYHQSGTRDAGR